MSEATRTDPVWLCAGCAHGFLVTVKYRPQRGMYALMGYDDSAPTPAPDTNGERDYTYCLCDHKILGATKTRRAKIDSRVVACDGFSMKAGSEVKP